MDETISNTMSDMNEDITAHVHEERGYDRGFTAGTKHAHDLLDTHLQVLKQKRAVIEEDWPRMDELISLQHQIHTTEQLKLLIRTGHYDHEQHTTT